MTSPQSQPAQDSEGARTRRPRRLHGLHGRLLFFLGDVLLLAGALVASVALWEERFSSSGLWPSVGVLFGLSLSSKVPLLYRERLYFVSWSYVGMEELIGVARAITIGSAIFVIASMSLSQANVLPSFALAIFVTDYTLSLLGIGAFRVSKRVSRRLLRRPWTESVPTLIVGAGAAGEQLVRSLLDTPGSGYRPVGFIDDDSAKWRVTLHGVTVLGPTVELPELAAKLGSTKIIVAMPSAPSSTIRRIVGLARSAGLQDISVLPALASILTGRVSWDELRQLELEDLLGREVVPVDMAEVDLILGGKRVLITGAGGSIGAELSRHVAKFSPSSVILLDFDETSLFDIHKELWVTSTGVTLIPVLADVRDERKVQQIFAELKPQVVFHAAAYKHVGLLERNPEEAVRTNVAGTANVAIAAQTVEAERFVFISTDKAVNPSSVMGATKRVGELTCLSLNQHGDTRFMAVRFGNVLGSRGSVVPIFREQIRRGGPVTVRGREVRRYFMAPSEAVLLVLQAAAIGQGGEVFALDMGEPVKIADLARELIRLAGMEPDKDIQITYTDLEPGEKETEDLLVAEEGTEPTQHQKIHIVRSLEIPQAAQVASAVARFRLLSEEGGQSQIISALQQLVSTYTPSSTALDTRHSPISPS